MRFSQARRPRTQRKTIAVLSRNSAGTRTESGAAGTMMSPLDHIGTQSEPSRAGPAPGIHDRPRSIPHPPPSVALPLADVPQIEDVRRRVMTQITQVILTSLSFVINQISPPIIPTPVTYPAYACQRTTSSPSSYSSISSCFTLA